MSEVDRLRTKADRLTREKQRLSKKQDQLLAQRDQLRELRVYLEKFGPIEKLDPDRFYREILPFMPPDLIITMLEAHTPSTNRAVHKALREVRRALFWQ